MSTFFYEKIHQAKHDAPYVDTEMTDIQYYAHYHEEVEIVVVLDGLLLLTLDGECHELKKDEIAIIHPFQIHSLESQEHSRLYIIKILSPFYNFSAVSRGDPVIRSENKDYDTVSACIQRLIREYCLNDMDPLKRLALRCATDTLLLQLARLPDMKPVTKDNILAHSKNIDLLRNVNEFLQEHYKENISLDDIAKISHMSKFYFIHSFKKATGTTFICYLNDYRLEHAMRMISETGESFTSIAMQCGFSSVRSFNRSFKNHYKITPTEARKNAARGARSFSED